MTCLPAHLPHLHLLNESPSPLTLASPSYTSLSFLPSLLYLFFPLLLPYILSFTIFTFSLFQFTITIYSFLSHFRSPSSTFLSPILIFPHLHQYHLSARLSSFLSLTFSHIIFTSHSLISHSLHSLSSSCLSPFSLYGALPCLSYLCLSFPPFFFIFCNFLSSSFTLTVTFLSVRSLNPRLSLSLIYTLTSHSHHPFSSCCSFFINFLRHFSSFSFIFCLFLSLFSPCVLYSLVFPLLLSLVHFRHHFPSLWLISAMTFLAAHSLLRFNLPFIVRYNCSITAAN